MAEASGPEKEETQSSAAEDAASDAADGPSGSAATAAAQKLLSPTMESLSSFQDHDMYERCDDMFRKLADYLKGELEAVGDDYTLLEQMNNQTATKYADMKQIGGNISKALQELNLKYKALTPVLQQIDEVEVNVNHLEQAAYRLDAYAKHLESRVKQLEKR